MHAGNWKSKDSLFRQAHLGVRHGTPSPPQVTIVPLVPCWYPASMQTTSDTAVSPPASAGAGLTLFAQQLLVVVLGLVFLVLVIYLLREFATVLKPLCVAGFIAYLVIPTHHWLMERGINRPLAAIALLALVIGLLASLGMLLYSNAETLVDKWPEYQLRWQQRTTSVLELLPGTLRDQLKQHQVDAKLAGAEVRSILGSFVSFLSVALIVIIYLAFLLAERASLPRRLETAYGVEKAQRILHVLSSISRAITEYISVKTFISVLGGVGTTLILLAFGVDFAFTWGALAFLLNFIPYLGSLLATVLPVLLALVQLDSTWQALLIGGLLVAMQQSLGVLVEPRMAGAKLGVSPLLIILSLAFWGVIWGIVGMLLAVPLLMVVKIVLENIPATKPVALLMGR